MKEIFIPVPVFDENEPITIHLAGISYCDENYKIVRHNSDIACFEYVISGSGTIVKDTELHPKAGDTYFLLEGEYHEYFSSADNPWTKIWINASGPLITSLIDAYSLYNQNIFHCDTAKYFKKIHKLLTTTELTPNEISSQISIVFHELIQAIAAHKDNKEPLATDAVIIKNYIDKNIYKQIVIEDLSQLICKSNAHTIRVFKKAYGVTPYQYYMDNRIQKSKSLLCETALSIKEIAFILNFCDEHYFTNLFKSKTGKNPTEYRACNLQIKK